MTVRNAAIDRLLVSLSLPVVCAPMFLISGPDLVAAACKAGLIGALPSANARDASQFADWIARVSEELTNVTGADGVMGPLAANLNVRSGERMLTPRYVADLETCRRYMVPLVITVNGDPTPVVPEVHSWGGLVFHDVTTLHHARKAVAAGVDGLIVICGGGGGHSGILNPFSFVPQVRQFFDGVIVLAGGIATGGAVFAAQALGADLCYMGTRFIATEESLAPAEYKAMLVSSQSDELVYTPAFTRGTPAMLLHQSVRAHGFNPLHLPPASEIPATIKPWRDIWAAGQGVGLIDDIPPVATLAERLRQEYKQAALQLQIKMYEHQIM
jgi:nitronate monooxygenase